MIFRKKRAKAWAAQLEHGNADQSYWSRVKNTFSKNRLAVWALRGLMVLVFIGVFSDFIANEKPIWCRIEGKTYWPVFKEYGVKMGFSTWEKQFFIKDWNEHNYDAKVMALIPYSGHSHDRKNTQFKSPFGDQDVSSTRYWHWLGTDQLGRDTAAGLVSGTRMALLVGLIAMSIATIIGLFFGAIAGYFGDQRLKISRGRLLLNIIGFPLAIFYGFSTRGFILSETNHFYLQLLLCVFIFVGIMLLFNLLAKVLKSVHFLSQKITIPADLLIMRFVEAIESIPGLLFILAMVSIFSQLSIFNVMVVIGLIAWTGITRFVRAELLRVRQLNYVEAAQAMGYPERNIIFRHALPNALTPVLIIIAFGIAGAILSEAFLSFLGIGLDTSVNVTWGSMLSLARDKFTAWWLALFPGIAIFITVSIFNLIGEGLSEALLEK